MDKLVMGESGDERTTEQKIQDEIAGDDVLVILAYIALFSKALI